jgi:hypothetical protein
MKIDTLQHVELNGFLYHILSHGKYLEILDEIGRIQHVVDENKRLRDDQLKVYKSDGSFDILGSPEEVVRRRIKFAGQIERLELENAALRKIKSRLEKTLIYVLLKLSSPNLEVESDEHETL